MHCIHPTKLIFYLTTFVSWGYLAIWSKHWVTTSVIFLLIHLQTVDPLERVVSGEFVDVHSWLTAEEWWSSRHTVWWVAFKWLLHWFKACLWLRHRCLLPNPCWQTERRETWTLTGSRDAERIGSAKQVLYEKCFIRTSGRCDLCSFRRHCFTRDKILHFKELKYLETNGETEN